MRLCAAAALLAAACASQRLEPSVRGLPRDDPDATLSAVWVGHATVLLRFGRHYVLTDPNLGGSILVQQRVTPASLTPAQVPPLDLVLVSHPHLDHLDSWTMKRLRAREVVFPAGAGGYVSTSAQREPLAPWQTIERGPLRITAVPIAHSGGRYVVDSLWNHAASGYVIEAYGRTVFFAGDTGYDPVRFKEIGRRFPGIDVAFLPIAPARGRNKNHASPQEALRIFAELGARYMIPIHFEAYRSTVVPIDEPRRVLAQEAARLGISDRVFALHTGEGWALPDARGEPPLVLEGRSGNLARK